MEEEEYVTQEATPTIFCSGLRRMRERGDDAYFCVYRCACSVCLPGRPPGPAGAVAPPTAGSPVAPVDLPRVGSRDSAVIPAVVFVGARVRGAVHAPWPWEGAGCAALSARSPIESEAGMVVPRRMGEVVCT